MFKCSIFQVFPKVWLFEITSFTKVRMPGCELRTFVEIQDAYVISNSQKIVDLKVGDVSVNERCFRI